MTRHRLAIVLAVLSVAAFVVALSLVHDGGLQSVPGSRTDPSDPDAPAESIRVRVDCASSARGPALTADGEGADIGDLDNDADAAEDDDLAVDRAGVDSAMVSDVCGRVRTARLTHAVELGFLGLLLGGSAVALSRSARQRATREPSAPADRRDDGAVL